MNEPSEQEPSTTPAEPAPIAVVVSCEHAGNVVPREYEEYFASRAAREALQGHRGWDPGALEIARSMGAILETPVLAQTVSRLLIESNRSLGHPQLWSEFSAGLSPVQRAEVIDRYWTPHRAAVRRRIEEQARVAERVVHVGVHTFTPVWKGRRRETDIGLLYDPARAYERLLAHRWRDRLVERDAGCRVHLNRPYRGWTDGLVTTLRSELPEDRYAGLELEISQRRVPMHEDRSAEIARALLEALA